MRFLRAAVNSTRLFPFTALPHSHAGTHARTPPRAMCPCRSWMKNRRFTQRSMWSWLWCVVVVVCCVLCRASFPAFRACAQHAPRVPFFPRIFLFSQDPRCSFCCRLSTKDGLFHLSVCHAMMFAGWDQDFACHAALWVALRVCPAPRPAPRHVPCPAPRSASRSASCLVLCSCPCVSFSHLPWLHSRSSAS